MSKKFSALPRLTVIAVAAILGVNAAQADELEVLHWWTSGGEAKAGTEPAQEGVDFHRFPVGEVIEAGCTAFGGPHDVFRERIDEHQVPVKGLIAVGSAG